MVRDKQHLQAVWFLMEMNIAFRPCSCGAQSELCDITKTAAYQADLPRATPLQSNCYLFPPIPVGFTYCSGTGQSTQASASEIHRSVRIRLSFVNAILFAFALHAP